MKQLKPFHLLLVLCPQLLPGSLRRWRRDPGRRQLCRDQRRQWLRPLPAANPSPSPPPI